MHVIVNGKRHELDTNINLQQLLEWLKIGKGRIAIELNGEILTVETKLKLCRQSAAANHHRPVSKMVRNHE